MWLYFNSISGFVCEWEGEDNAAVSHDDFDYEAFLDSYVNLADAIDFTYCLVDQYQLDESRAILNNAMTEETLSEGLVQNLQSNEAFIFAYAAWETGAIVNDPIGTLAENTMTKQMLLETVLFKLLEAEYKQNSAIDWVAQKSVTNTLSISKSLLKFAKANQYAYIANNYEFSAMTDDQKKVVTDWCKEYVSGYSNSGDYVSLVSQMLGYCKDIESLTETLGTYLQLIDVSEATVAFLEQKKAHTVDIDLIKTIDEVIAIEQDSFNAYCQKALEEGILKLGTKYVLSQISSKISKWIEKLLGGSFSNGVTIYNGVKIGTALGLKIGDICFSVNKKLDTFELLRALIFIEEIAEATFVDVFNSYDGSLEKAELVSAGVDFLYAAYKADAEYFKEMVELAERTWIGGISDAEANALKALGDAKVAEYQAEYDSLTEFTGSCGASATWVLLSNGYLLIMGEGAVKDYNLGEAPWYENRDKIVRIYVSSKITSIGKYALYGLGDIDYPIVIAGGIAFKERCIDETKTRLILLGNGSFTGELSLQSNLYSRGSVIVKGPINIDKGWQVNGDVTAGSSSATNITIENKAGE